MLRMVHWITENLKDGVDCEGEDGDRPLHIACLYGHLSCVQVLRLSCSCPFPQVAVSLYLMLIGKFSLCLQD